MIVNEGVGGGKKLPTLTNPAAAGDLLENKQLIDANGNILTGTMPPVDHPNPTISVGANGLITASHAQGSGKVTGGTTSATRQLTTQAGTTITPGTSQKTAVASGRYTTGNVYVAGSSNLKAANIKSGVNIFGVTGSYAGGSYTSNMGAFNLTRYSAYIGLNLAQWAQYGGGMPFSSLDDVVCFYLGSDTTANMTLSSVFWAGNSGSNDSVAVIVGESGAPSFTADISGNTLRMHIRGFSGVPNVDSNSYFFLYLLKN